MRVLAGGHGDVAPFHAGVGAAFDKVKPAHRRQAHDLVHRKNHGRLDQTVICAIDHQAVLGRVDVPPALVVALKMQTAGCHDTKQGLQWGERDGGLRRLCQSRAGTPLHIGFKLRRLAVTVARDRLP